MDYRSSTSVGIPQNGEAPATRVAKFFSKETEDLYEILESFGEFEASEAVLELVRMPGEPPFSEPKMLKQLRVIRDALTAIPFLVVEHAAFGGVGPRDLHTAMRWYGAHIADFVEDCSP